MKHTPNWQTWEGGAGNVWIGYTDPHSGFQIPRMEVVYKLSQGSTKAEASALASEVVMALNDYPALVAACQAIVAAFTTPVGVPIRKAFPTAQDPRSTYLSPAGIMVPSEVYELARNALAAAGADKPEDYGIDPEYEAMIADVGLHGENAQAMSDPLPLLDGTIQEEV